MNSIPVKFLLGKIFRKIKFAKTWFLGKTFGKNPADVAENAIQGSPKLGTNSQTAKGSEKTAVEIISNKILEEQEELLRQRELEEKQLAEKQAVRRYERANVRENIRDKYKLTKGS